MSRSTIHIDRLNDETVERYMIKSNVFSNLFREKKYLFQLYRAIHPEDTSVTEESLTDVAIHNIMTDDIYNNLAFLAGNRLIIVVEVQAGWTANVIIHCMVCLLTTYQDYFRSKKTILYQNSKVSLPIPEFYVIDTENAAQHQEYISLSREFFDGATVFMEARAKVFYDCRGDDIISQYIAFRKIYKEQIKSTDIIKDAVAETIRLCRKRGILKEYLENREKEVISIMLAVYDEKEILRDYIESERYEAAKEAELKADRRTAKQMLKDGGMSLERIQRYVPSLTVEEIRKLQEELLRYSTNARQSMR